MLSNQEANSSCLSLCACHVFIPEDGGSTFLQNVDEFVLGCMVLHAIVNPKPNIWRNSFPPVSVLMHWTGDNRKNNLLAPVCVNEEGVCM
jgi:hypothetical protein